MVFAHDTTVALTLGTDLVNTARDGDALTGVDALDVFLDQRHLTPRRAATPSDVTAVQALRPQLRAVWQASGPEELAGIINRLLRDSGARPWLVDHGGGWGWHLHVTEPSAPLAHRIGAQAGFAFADLVRLGAADRLGTCDAPGCDAVLVDLSRNRSRRYCDTGNCGNRQHVAAYRARRAPLGG